MAAEWRSEGAPSQCKVVSSLLYIISSWFNIKERRRRIMYAVWQRPSVLAHIPPWWAEGSLAKGGSFVDSSSELSKYVEEAEARYISQKRIYPSVFSNRLLTDKLLQKCSKWGFQGELCICTFSEVNIHDLASVQVLQYLNNTICPSSSVPLWSDTWFCFI